VISIVTPVRAGGHIFQETYDSVIAQSENDFEWLVVVDFNKGDPFAQLEYRSLDARIKLLFNTSEKNGAGISRNIALDHASGNFITFIDADDEWAPEFLKVSKEFLTKKNVDCCCSGYRRIKLEARKKLTDFMPLNRINSSLTILAGCDISCLTFFARWGPEFSDIRFGDYRARNDLVFFYRYLDRTGGCYSTNQILAKYNIGTNTVSSNKLRLLKYQILVSREVAGLSRLSSYKCLIMWFVYGFNKYRR
jgi:teichuronic acid biosynthesis glycosyltransferase TuaG